MGKNRKISAHQMTDFEAQVYAAVKQIPRGEVRTYGWVARCVGRPLAARAVGNALHNNPFAPIVPCHRVVAKNGLGGFAGGLEKKRRLLRSEGYPC
jgi:methylated-DNA-[protein]-cysteine S-methyltransferase